jgi:hypothetical protein
LDLLDRLERSIGFLDIVKREKHEICARADPASAGDA